MVKILANDGISDDGRLLLEEAGYQVDATKIPQEQLAEVLPAYDAVIVRSATKIRKELIDQCPNLRLIARAGVSVDNIDVEYAQSKGIKVINTANAAAQSVAELVFAHIFALARQVHLANNELSMPDADFKGLKAKYSNGLELRGKTIGILGFGRVGQAVARTALGLGMNVLPVDLVKDEFMIDISVFSVKNIAFSIKLETVELDYMLQNADFITLHIPYTEDAPILRQEHLKLVKSSAFLINAAQGGVIRESDLLDALEKGQIAGAGIDVFENEPKPSQALLTHPKVLVTPHIGGSTASSRTHINFELADRIIDFFGTDEA